MAAPTPIPPENLLDGQDFLQEIKDRPDALVYFLCNVGDGDAQLLLLPQAAGAGGRQAVVVDCAVTGKIPPLLASLAGQGIVVADGAGAEPIALVVATHPHQDHMGGMPELLAQFGPQIAEFWDPGYYHVLAAYHQTMAAIEALPQLLYAQPASGLRRWIGDVAITVLSPSVSLKNRFDSYGTEINDSSISLRIEFPVHRLLESRANVEEGGVIEHPSTCALVLGADAQTLSWSYVLVDFPLLFKSGTPAAKAIGAAQADTDALAADVLKVSHHGSKHGVNLELVERIAPKLTLVSSVGGGGEFFFPHTVTQEVIREGLDPSAGHPHPHPEDYKLGVFYAADTDGQRALGSIALVMSPDRCTMWRFGDAPLDAINLTAVRKWAQDVW